MYLSQFTVMMQLQEAIDLETLTGPILNMVEGLGIHSGERFPEY